MTARLVHRRLWHYTKPLIFELKGIPEKMTRLIVMTMLLLLAPPLLLAGDAPQQKRHDLMEQSKEAAKTVGAMLKGQRAFDAADAMTGLQIWADVAGKFGALFPEGSETGYDTEAKATIWTDREGFDKQLAMFSEATEKAVAANPQSLDELKLVAQPIFKSCKGCHEEYRVDDDK